SDKTVVMRVYVPDEMLSPELLPDLRWRGIVFDRFDGRTWAVGHAERIPVRRWPITRFPLPGPAGRGIAFKQDIYLDPIGTEIILAAPQVLRVNLPTGIVHVDDMESLSVPNVADRLHYQVESEVEAIPPSLAAIRDGGSRMSPGTRNRYLQL